MRTRNRQRGFSLIELLVVVAIIGLLASVVIPNLLDAMHRAKQRRTMADLRGLGTAWMSWLTDQTGAAAAGSGKVYDVAGYSEVEFPTLAGYLRPTDTFFYAQEVPQFDAWGHPYRFAMGAINGLVIDRLLICSRGRDDALDTCAEPLIPVGPFHSTDYAQDIVWADGYFVRWPDALR